MTDTLEIFGTEYTGVTGIKATDSNSGTKTYIRPVGTKSITENGTGIDVAEYASVDVSVSGGSPTIQSLTVTPSTSQQTFNASGVDGYKPVTVNAMPSGTAGTPTATKGTVSNHSVTVTPSVTNTAGYISGGTINGTSVTVSASELVSGTYTVDSSGTKDVTNYASASVPAGTAGTPSASKSTVSNHSVSVTPSVTNATGWITGSTKTGTAVTVTASELASGNKAITQNGTGIDVVGYSTVSVDVQGGGGSPVQTAFAYPSSVTSSTVTFTNLQGEPTSFILMIDGGGVAPSSTAIVDAVVYDNSNLHGQTIVSGTNAVTYNGSAFSKSYSNGTLTVTSNSPQFSTSVDYILGYSYGGSPSNIDTKDVQVGSGATSITFTGLEDEPVCWSCIFKSNFGTSSGYQRVIFVSRYGNNVYGHAMDSATKESSSGSSSYWTASYSNGSLTITSQGTNQGGYFHQPGYYQLTYAYDDGSSGNYQTKTVTPTTSAQEVTADTGYDALKKVTVNAIPSEYIVPSGNINITSNTATGQTLNVAQYATATVAVPSSGSSKNVQVAQSTTRVASSTYTNLISLTCSTAGKYDIYWDCFRSNTGGTNGSQLYINGTAQGTANTTFTNHIQNNHLTNVTLAKNDVVAVYARSRGSNYYAYVGQLTIIET